MSEVIVGIFVIREPQCRYIDFRRINYFRIDGIYDVAIQVSKSIFFVESFCTDGGGSFFAFSDDDVICEFEERVVLTRFRGGDFGSADKDLDIWVGAFENFDELSGKSDAPEVDADADDFRFSRKDFVCSFDGVILDGEFEDFRAVVKFWGEICAECFEGKCDVRKACIGGNKDDI